MARGLQIPPFVRLPVLLVLAAGLLFGGGALALDLVVETDEEAIEALVRRVASADESDRGAAFLRETSLEAHPLEVSAPGLEHIYDAADRTALLDLVAHVSDEIDGADLAVLQTRVETHGETARATLNIRARRGGDDRFLPVDVTLRRLDDGWVVARVRLQQ